MFFFYPFKLIGGKVINFIRELGKMAIFLGSSLYSMLLPPYRPFRVTKQVYFIGVKTISVIVLTGLFTGMALTLQAYYVLITFGAESKLGAITSLSLIRELGPVISALMVIGRAGSALTAEIGIMRISEQIDALTVMALNPTRYLVVPPIVAGLLTFPLMTALFDVVGIFGGYLVSVELLGLSSGTYFGEMQNFVDMTDIMTGFWKALSFGVIVSWVCTYKGFHCGHGAEGVARATTQAVVLSSVLILVWDYFLGSVLP